VVEKVAREVAGRGREAELKRMVDGLIEVGEIRVNDLAKGVDNSFVICFRAEAIAKNLIEI